MDRHGLGSWTGRAILPEGNKEMQVPRTIVVVCLVALLAATVLGAAQAQIGARAMGMGGAFVGLADDPTATFYNPAALPFLTGSGLNYTRRMNNRNDNGAVQDFITIVAPLDPETAVGASFLRQRVLSFSMYNPLTTEFNSVRWDQSQYWASVGVKIDPTTSLGANLRWTTNNAKATVSGATSDVDINTDFELDLAIYHRFTDAVSAGLVLANVNEPGETGSVAGLPAFTPDKIKRTYSPGVAVRLPDGFTAAVQVQDLGDAVDRSLRVGAEKTFTRGPFGVALRAGWFGDEDAVTFGAGALFQGWSVDTAIVDPGGDATWLLGVTGSF